MTPHHLAAKVRKLRDRVPITAAFERVLMRRGVWSNSDVWYKSQKDHCWLSEYSGPGYYEQRNPHRSAEFVYNHVVCPPMIPRLGEASGIPEAKVAAANRAALLARPQLPAKCAAIRKIIPWEMIEARLDGERT
jgi:hypothetical protein